MAELFQRTKPLISSWSSTPVPGLSLSAAGLLALADLHTVAQRTAIAGGSSWLDALVLAPGLHYQQAVDALGQDSSEPDLSAVLQRASSATGAAETRYVRRLWQEARRSTCGAAGGVAGVRDPDAAEQGVLGGLVPAPGRGAGADRLSHLLYLASPVLTLVASALMVLLRDWWGAAFIAALMASRVLNIWSIKQRMMGVLPPPKQGEYAVDLGSGSPRVVVVLRGLESDIRAVTTQAQLRRQTAAESHLEAAAKLIVYLAAALSGNQTQAGAMVLMALLLTSAGLLGLSNARSRGVQMNGRVAKLQSAVGAVARAEAEAEAGVVGDRESGHVGGRLFEDLDLRKSIGGESDVVS